MTTGQAAGTAAAFSLQVGKTPREIDPSVITKQLDEDRAATPNAMEKAASGRPQGRKRL